MSVNAAIWRWSSPYDSSSKRHRRGITMDDIYDVIIDDTGPHEAQAEFDQPAFIADLEAAIGPQAPDGDWIAEHYNRAVVLNLPNDFFDLLPQIQRVANSHTLNVSAQI
jgi:hypothetical protein